MSASIPSWARVGAKVVCVDAATRHSSWPSTGLIGGRVYTVSWVGKRPTDEQYGMMVEGVSAPSAVAGIPWCYRFERFRPAIFRTSEEEDLAHFTHHLNQPVDA